MTEYTMNGALKQYDAYITAKETTLKADLEAAKKTYDTELAAAKDDAAKEAAKTKFEAAEEAANAKVAKAEKDLVEALAKELKDQEEVADPKDATKKVKALDEAVKAESAAIDTEIKNLEDALKAAQDVKVAAYVAPKAADLNLAKEVKFVDAAGADVVLPAEFAENFDVTSLKTAYADDKNPTDDEKKQEATNETARKLIADAITAATKVHADATKAKTDNVADAQAKVAAKTAEKAKVAASFDDFYNNLKLSNFTLNATKDANGKVTELKATTSVTASTVKATVKSQVVSDKLASVKVQRPSVIATKAQATADNKKYLKNNLVVFAKRVAYTVAFSAGLYFAGRALGPVISNLASKYLPNNFAAKVANFTGLSKLMNKFYATAFGKKVVAFFSKDVVTRVFAAVSNVASKYGKHVVNALIGNAAATAILSSKTLTAEANLDPKSGFFAKAGNALKKVFGGDAALFATTVTVDANARPAKGAFLEAEQNAALDALAAKQQQGNVRKMAFAELRPTQESSVVAK
ncbi:MAG: hypothetical protein J0G32_04210 [Alphaproteobacteria bacterium]|nr:hypothetical protein [Alphaproteobacteria bacterium]OJV13707.1 MAG: hypothetical protein BGO27_00860 [Alphaproteobacteria bacterium 33-17]